MASNFNNADAWKTLLRNRFMDAQQFTQNLGNQAKNYLNATRQEVDDLLGKGTSKLINEGNKAAQRAQKYYNATKQEVGKILGSGASKVLKEAQKAQDVGSKVASKAQNMANSAAKSVVGKPGMLGKIAGGAIAAGSAANDLRLAYEKGGVEGVKQALPGIIGTYGGGTAGLALGSAAGSALPIPNPILKAGTAGALALGGGISGALGGNALANWLTGSVPEMSKEEVDKIINDFDPKELDKTLEAANKQIKEIDEIVNSTNTGSGGNINTMGNNNTTTQPLTSEQQRILRDHYGIGGQQRSQTSPVPPQQQALPQNNGNNVPPVQNTTAQQSMQGQVYPEVVGGIGGVDYQGNPQTGAVSPTSPGLPQASMYETMFNQAAQLQQQNAIPVQQIAQLLQQTYAEQQNANMKNPYYQGSTLTPQGYNIDVDRLRRQQEADRWTNEYRLARGLQPLNYSTADRMVQDANQLYRAQMAMQAGVPYEDYIRGVTLQQTQNIQDRTNMLKQLLDARYKAASNDVERMKVLGDLRKVELQGQYEIANTIREGQNNLNNTNLKGQYDLEKERVAGQQALNKANLQGQYSAAIANMKLQDPSTQFRNVMSGLNYLLLTNPGAAGTLLQSLDPRIMNQLFKNNPELIRQLGGGSPTSYQARQAQQQGLLPPFVDFFNNLRGIGNNEQQ